MSDWPVVRTCAPVLPELVCGGSVVGRLFSDTSILGRLRTANAYNVMSHES